MDDRFRVGILSQYVVSRLALHPPGVAKSSTSFAGVRVGMPPLRDSIWHVNSNSDEAVCCLLNSV